VTSPHIARALLGNRDVLALEDALALPARTGVGVTRLPPPQPRPLVIECSSTRWRDIVGWIGILLGAAVLVAALAAPLGDPALEVALMLAMRGRRVILSAGPMPPAPVLDADRRRGTDEQRR
jgi:hypothetical protein